MNEKRIDKILTVLIIIFILGSIIVMAIGYLNNEKVVKDYSFEEENLIPVDSYEEITIAYSILNKYLLCYREKDYNKLCGITNEIIDEEVFEKNSRYVLDSIDNNDKEEFIISQYQISEDKYIIKYTLDNEKTLTMIYSRDKQDYSFIIEKDTLIGEIYE